MTGIFRQKNSSNTLLLLLYALVLKFGLFLHPVAPVQTPDDHYLYKGLLSFLAPLHLSNVVYSLLAFGLLYTQASLFNRICNLQKMLPKPNYLPAMSYILISSLLPEWSYFSAPLVINSLLIWIFYRVMLLYNSSKAASSIYNIGLVTGFLTLLYQPAILYVLVLWLSFFIMRPFIIREWLIALLGVTTPYYFFFIYLYLTNHWSWSQLTPKLHFSIPAMPQNVFITISISLLVLVFMIGGFYIQNNLNKMLIQVRKNWSLLLLLLIVSTFITLINGGAQPINWVLCMVPLACFHAAAYFYPNSKTFPLVLHWNLFAFALYMNYWH